MIRLNLCLYKNGAALKTQLHFCTFFQDHCPRESGHDARSPHVLQWTVQDRCLRSDVNDFCQHGKIFRIFFLFRFRYSDSVILHTVISFFLSVFFLRKYKYVHLDSYNEPHCPLYCTAFHKAHDALPEL